MTRSKWPSRHAVRKVRAPHKRQSTAPCHAVPHDLEFGPARSHPPAWLGAPVSFVSIKDVVPLVVGAVIDPDLRGRVLEICGPEAVSMSELAEMVMEKHSWSGRPRRIPPPVLHLVANTVGVVKPGIRRQIKAALAVDELPTRTDHSLRREFPALSRTAVSAVVARP